MAQKVLTETKKKGNAGLTYKQFTAGFKFIKIKQNSLDN
jgi:hypothetical protein